LAQDRDSSAALTEAHHPAPTRRRLGPPGRHL